MRPLHAARSCRASDKKIGARGFEPPTPWSRTRCSTRLSHAPTRSNEDDRNREGRRPEGPEHQDSVKKYSTCRRPGWALVNLADIMAWASRVARPHADDH